MYLAEIHGKLSRENENKEDILTSNVFSFFKYTDREIFLLPFLHSLGLEVTPEEAKQAEFAFWPSFADGTQPDLVLLPGEYYLLIEAKYRSGFGAETPESEAQLIREIKGGILEANSLDKNIRLITITAHYYFDPEIFQDIPEPYQSDTIWINWQKIAYLLFSILENQPDIRGETRLFAEDLYRLLLKKNLRNFEGVAVLGEMGMLQVASEAIFFDARSASYRGDFIGFLPALQTLPKISKPQRVLFLNTQRGLFDNLTTGSHLMSPHPGTIFWRS